MCGCKDIEIGSYDNQVVLKSPKWSSHKTICVDRCIEREIKHLWGVGIITTGCCCGHNKEIGFIGVDFDFIDRMKSMGYTVVHNSCRPNDEDSFKPKSI